MAKRNIKIDIVSSTQSLRVTKRVLASASSNNTNKKSIVCANSAKSLENAKDSVDSWIDQEHPFLGDAFLITGDTEPELKLAFAQEFANEVEEDFIIDEDDFFRKSPICNR